MIAYEQAVQAASTTPEEPLPRDRFGVLVSWVMVVAAALVCAAVQILGVTIGTATDVPELLNVAELGPATHLEPVTWDLVRAVAQ